MDDPNLTVTIGRILFKIVILPATAMAGADWHIWAAEQRIEVADTSPAFAILAAVANAQATSGQPGSAA